MYANYLLSTISSTSLGLESHDSVLPDAKKITLSVRLVGMMVTTATFVNYNMCFPYRKTILLHVSFRYELEDISQ